MSSNHFVVVYDANVLYPANLRDLLLHLLSVSEIIVNNIYYTSTVSGIIA